MPRGILNTSDCDYNNNIIPLTGIVAWGPQVDEILEVGEAAKRQVSESQRTPLVSLLLRGNPGCGKTALAAHNNNIIIAKQCNFPFVKVSLLDSI